jgi:hypothetical protein
MPDLITHVAVAHLIKRPFEVTYPSKDLTRFRIFFYLGVMLPDLLSRPWYILFPRIQDWVTAFLTPFGALLACGFIALLFEKPLRFGAFRFLLSGSALHFALDCLQKQVVGNNFWLFPFSWKTFGIGLFWTGDAIPFIPLWVALVLLMEGILYFKKRRSRRLAVDNPE